MPVVDEYSVLLFNCFPGHFRIRICIKGHTTAEAETFSQEKTASCNSPSGIEKKFFAILPKDLFQKLPIVTLQELCNFDIFLKYPLTLKGDQHLISPCNNTLEANAKVMRIKEMITN